MIHRRMCWLRRPQQTRPHHEIATTRSIELISYLTAEVIAAVPRAPALRRCESEPAAALGSEPKHGFKELSLLVVRVRLKRTRNVTALPVLRPKDGKGHDGPPVPRWRDGEFTTLFGTLVTPHRRISLNSRQHLCFPAVVRRATHSDERCDADECTSSIHEAQRLRSGASVFASRLQHIVGLQAFEFTQQFLQL